MKVRKTKSCSPMGGQPYSGTVQVAKDGRVLSANRPVVAIEEWEKSPARLLSKLFGKKA